MVALFVALCIAIFLLCICLGAIGMRKDTEKENRRRAAIKASQVAANFGLKRFPKILECYAVGDYSGIAHEVKQIAEMAFDQTALAAELDAVLKSVVTHVGSTADGRAKISSLLSSVTPA